jgi:hypothetical protein
MKKIYQAPQVKVYRVQVKHHLLTTSIITPSGSSNALLFSDDDAEEDEEARAKSNYFDLDW